VKSSRYPTTVANADLISRNTNDGGQALRSGSADSTLAQNTNPSPLPTFQSSGELGLIVALVAGLAGIWLWRRAGGARSAEHQSQNQPQNQLQSDSDQVEAANVSRWELQLARCTPAMLANADRVTPLQWLDRGQLLARLKRYPEAVENYDRGLAYHPDNFHLWHERGLTLARMQRFSEAVLSYNRAAEIQPHNHDLQHERGDTLLELERFEEAVVAFDRCLAHGQSAHILGDRGYALCRLGRYAEALEALSLSCHLDPKMAYTWYYKIEALLQLGQVETALETVEEALQRLPERATLLTQRERIQNRLGQVTAD
jgi:tetratricopeptide (TPR) repeat protein